MQNKNFQFLNNHYNGMLSICSFLEFICRHDDQSVIIIIYLQNIVHFKFISFETCHGLAGDFLSCYLPPLKKCG